MPYLSVLLAPMAVALVAPPHPPRRHTPPPHRPTRTRRRVRPYLLAPTPPATAGGIAELAHVVRTYLRATERPCLAGVAR